MVTESESELFEVEETWVGMETWASALERGQHVVSKEMNCEVHLLDGVVDDEREFLLRVFASWRWTQKVEVSRLSESSHHYFVVG